MVVVDGSGTEAGVKCELQVSEEMCQEERMLEMLKSERQDLESEVCRFRVMKAKLLQQIACV